MARTPKFHDGQDEITFEDTDNTPSNMNNNYDNPQGGGLTLDDLGSFSTDTNKADEEEYQKLKPPKGDWQKVEVWKFSHRTNNNDTLPGDIDTSGRTYFNFAGYPLPREANGVEHKPMLFIRVSPDKRSKQNDPNKNDMAYTLWLKAKNDLYLALYRELPKTYRQVVDMLENDEYIVRTMNGDSGTVVVDIKAKRGKRE